MQSSQEVPWTPVQLLYPSSSHAHPGTPSFYPCVPACLSLRPWPGAGCLSHSHFLTSLGVSWLLFFFPAPGICTLPLLALWVPFCACETGIGIAA